MKNTNRFASGFISSVLLAVGMVRTAEYFDPLSSRVADKSLNRRTLPMSFQCVPCAIERIR